MNSTQPIDEVTVTDSSSGYSSEGTSQLARSARNATAVARSVAAADAAAAAFSTWAEVGPTERRSLLVNAADAMQSRAREFTELMGVEIGATAAWAAFNVRLAGNILREAAAMTTQVIGEVIPSDRPGCLALSVREPVGVVLGIAPWNAPLILGIRAIAMPLACANTVVLKGSEVSPKTHSLIGAVLREAGLPEGVVNVVTNATDEAPAVVDALIAHPAIRRVNFTGSTRVGRIIAETAGRHLKPALLELGGKAPLIIRQDADLDEAVRATAFGAFMNQGQICMSTERVVVHHEIADEFIRRLVEKTASMPVGDPNYGNVAIGSLISRTAAERAAVLVKQAVAAGAVQRCGGRLDGKVMDPVILDHVTRDMTLYHEESFAPVVCIIRASSDEESLTIANDTEYGLVASIFTRDVATGLRLAKRLRTGICHINSATVHDEAQMPFGGVKASGYGRFGGKAGIEQFTDLRWLTIGTQPVHYPI